MSDYIPKAVSIAARVRTHGGSWQQAAEESEWSLVGLIAWTRKYPMLWAREMGIARRDARDAACDEAVAMLRKQLRSDDPKALLSAAAALTSRFAGPKRLPKVPPAFDPADPWAGIPPEQMEAMFPYEELEPEELPETVENGGDSHC